jgi:hypothetical protein
MPGFLSSRPNWVPHALTRKRVLLPPFGSYWGDTLACGGGGRENPAVRTTGQKLSCSVYYNPFTPLCYIKTKNMTSRIDSCKGYDKLTCEVMRWVLNRLHFFLYLWYIVWSFQKPEKKICNRFSTSRPIQKILALIQQISIKFERPSKTCIFLLKLVLSRQLRKGDSRLLLEPIPAVQQT